MLSASRLRLRATPPPPPPFLNPRQQSFNFSPTHRPTTTATLRRNSLQTKPPDAAQQQSFDFLLLRRRDDAMLKIAIIGFGNYGQFLAKTLVAEGHTVLAHSRSDHSETASSLGVSFFPDPDDLCEQHPDVIVLCTSVISAESVVKSLPLRRLRRDTLFVDVLSVKEFAKELLLNSLPADLDLVCTHPMFGPQSAKPGRNWAGLYFVYEKVRVGSEGSRTARVEKFLSVFEKQGCTMVEMSCSEHDKYAAGSQFMTHTVGRVLGMLGLKPTPISTRGYEALLDLAENTGGDSFDLYYGLFVYNKNALEMLKRLDSAFEELKKQLFGRLHDVTRKQLFGNEEKATTLEVVGCAQNGAALSSSCSGTPRLPEIARPPRDNKALISDDNSRLKIAIVGFGNFGQFLAKTLVRQGHTVLGFSRTDYSDVAHKLGVSYFSDANDLCEEHPDVILLCTSILSTEKVLKSLPLQRLKRNTLFVDVLSVKEFPRSLFLQALPPNFDVLCTHPMFGPESGKNGWNGLPFVYDKVRIGSDESRISRCAQFLDIFAREGCRMVEMSCAEHDRHAAGSQFITHTIGRILEKLGLERTPINTKGYETLLNLVENTAGDSFDLYYGLFMYNINAMEQLKRLDMAFECLKKQLFGRLHGVIRKELFENADKSEEQPLVPRPSQMNPSFEALNIQKN